MLFDIQGRRRRVVQATYLTLAVLLGGGLVLFGIGGEVQGGLVDAFSDDDGSGGGDQVIEDRVDRNEQRVKSGQGVEGARKELVRDYFSLASAQVAEADTNYPEEARDELRKAAANWQAYLRGEPAQPDPSLARVVLQVYDPLALNQPKEAQEAARIIAEAENNANSYLNLVQYAVLAKDTRTADLAEQKALDLAPKDQRPAVRAQIEQIKAPPPSQGTPTAPQGTPSTPVP